ncbi:30S ribosomal protein S6 [Lapidilactobacillus achengensis]|uniref:Small ribosomal subunit protein bS6 n=1 Tax=Lapidilactobacillus achengensis TaxID=2486000 RepID=A0ABW1UNJ6_9LACO|nr:30S ribosomal protein S6 [Lapidilactobacillus achengensis]
MAQTFYEVTYIIKPDLEEEAKAALIKRYDDVLGSEGAELVDSKDWSKRRLAYEINDYREGIYHIVNVKSDNDASVNEFDRLSKIDGSVLRHMIVKRDDKN